MIFSFPDAENYSDRENRKSNCMKCTIEVSMYNWIQLYIGAETESKWSTVYAIYKPEGGC